MKKIYTVSLMVLLGSCNPATRMRVERAVAQTLISDEQEGKLGLQVRNELEQQGVRYVTEPQVVEYVRQLATPILRQAQNDRRNVRWQVDVIDDPKTVNAFATPGGYLYVYTGLLKAAGSESEVAGILGHEAAHVTLRHSARQLVNSYGMQTVAAMALGENPSTLKKLVAGIVSQGAMLAYSRADEQEADTYGTIYSHSAGFDANGIASFFDRMSREQGKTPAFMTWLSTHPSNEDRVQAMRKLISEKGLRGGTRDSEKFLAIKQSLK